MTPELPTSPSITVSPATPDRWPDLAVLFASIPCWCQYWRLSASAYGRSSTGESLEDTVVRHQQTLQRQLDAPIAPGMLAYADGEIAGWCGFGPRSGMERLVRSRTIPYVDTLPVWSIVCFLVRVGFRRRGIARALLAGVIAYARAHSAPVLEAYPVDPGDRRINGTFAYVGTLPMFERAGFQKVIQTSAHSAGLPRWLMRLDLG